ncbi:MAG: UDP-N-acetylmuramoyl-L-alanine--D-glutamate ligase [Candidatus Riflebacteria bacterium]|nr:UDP-N-acetylmuramoyl-L-alanine--D-glutamate ligase [Candidatus Riflebacteria bacterium]
MDIQGRHISVIGAAKSGLAAAKTLARLGAKILLSDTQDRSRLEATLAEAALPADVEIETGGHSERILESDFIVLSPGVPPTIPVLKKAAAKGIPILSEIEIAYRISKGRRFVVTGSNGKTTTTTLLSQFCKTFFPRVFLGGNIGIPIMEFAADTRDDDVQVLEVSSFQLETTASFTPDIALITNFYENHLDRYPSYEAYRAAKERIALNMTEKHIIVLNADQSQIMDPLASIVRARVAWFGRNLGNRKPGVTLRDGKLVFISDSGTETLLFNESSIRIMGAHNCENVMAAATMALLAGVPHERLEPVVAAFPGVEHRLEWVRKRRDTTFINDSKGTNCAASIIALRACRPPVVLIAGGRDKGTDLADWVTAVRDHAKGVVLLGEARERFRAALEGIVPIKSARSFSEAVDLAAEWAIPDDTVLLSPACSSYDLFPNFEVRGKTFKELVLALPE